MSLEYQGKSHHVPPEENEKKESPTRMPLSLKGSKLDFRHFYLSLLYCYSNLFLSKSQLLIIVSRRIRFSPCLDLQW